MVRVGRNLQQKSSFANAVASEQTRIGEDGSGRVVGIHIMTHLRNPISHPCPPLAQMSPGPMIQAPWPWILYSSPRSSWKCVVIPHFRGVPSLLLEESVGLSEEETCCPLDDDSVAAHADGWSVALKRSGLSVHTVYNSLIIYMSLEPEQSLGLTLSEFDIRIPLYSISIAIF